MSRRRQRTHSNPPRNAYVEASVRQISDLMHPNPPLHGPRKPLHPSRSWPANAWTVITVTIANHLPDFPESLMHQGAERRLIAYLGDQPDRKQLLDAALYRCGFRIQYPRQED